MAIDVEHGALQGATALGRRALKLSHKRRDHRNPQSITLRRRQPSPLHLRTGSTEPLQTWQETLASSQLPQGLIPGSEKQILPRIQTLNAMDELPEFPKFRNLAFEDKALLDVLFKEMQPQMSKLTFTNLFVWNETERVQLSRLDKTVLLQRIRIRDGKTVLMPPLGKQPISTVLERIKKATVESQPEMLLYGINSEEAKRLSAEGYRVEPDRDDWDYVYLTSDLADLPGDKYHSKRNFITRCLFKYKCEYVKIDPTVVNDCLQLQTQWCNLRKCDAFTGLEAENRAIRAIFDNYELLGVSGGAVYIDDKLEAFTFAEPLNSDTAVIHFEKANPEITGQYQLINQWYCQNALRIFRFVNREQDLGVPGLRNAKLSYHPHHMIEKYIAYMT